MKPSLPRLLAVITVALLAVTQPAHAQVSLTTVYTFSAPDASSHNTDGRSPFAALILGQDGNYYGAAEYGGSNDGGTIFSLTPAGVFTALHQFTGTDGRNVRDPLLQGSDGTLYGTTVEGGAFGYGTVFSYVPGGALTTLHSFTAGNDGFWPAGGLVRGNDGNLYGVTIHGGANGNGTVYSISTTGTLVTVYAFSATDGNGHNSDGTAPFGGLVLGRDGILYGTAEAGGSTGNGTIFAITSAGALTTLHNFNGDTDGGYPGATLVQGGDGKFYGTTTRGGSYGAGTVFSVTSTGSFATLHTFDPGADGGDRPQAPLVQGNDGALYGSTDGGIVDNGTLFSITPAGTFTPLYSFTGNDGAHPDGALLLNGDGSFFGTTYNGGSAGEGTIFRLKLRPGFFNGAVALSNGVYYLAFSNGDYFGYYSFLTDPHYIYHFDLGYEYVFDADDGKSGVYLYDFKSGTFFYTSPAFPFPYLYDFSLNTVLYYYPDPNNTGHYNTNGTRYFYNFATGKIISK